MNPSLGRNFEALDPLEWLAAALQEAVEDREEAARRARRAREVLAARFTVEKQGSAWRAAADAAIRSHGAAR